jgi:hypothetical protein
MRRQSGFLAGNGERGPNLTAIFHPPVFPHGLLDFCTMLKGRSRSWSCENVRPGEPGDAKLNLACYCNCEPESTWFARSAVSDLVAPMRTPHVWIAAMSGFTPRMFMTRVRL